MRMRVIIMGKIITLENVDYEVVSNYKNAFCMEDLEERYTEYFLDFDYILGDYSYDSLRLKGFFDSKNKQCRKLNDIDDLDQYIQKYCAYECRYFLLKKTKKDKKNG